MIPLSEPHMSGEEAENVAHALANNQIAQGRDIGLFEAKMAEYLGIPHTCAVSSGTAALHLALLVLDIGPESTVLCSDLTFIGGVAPILYVGARPIFVDCDYASWCMDSNILENAIALYHPEAIVVTDLYGQACNPKIYDICEAHGVKTICDSCESLGCRPVSRADVSIYSFNGNKIITSGGGGMLASKNSDLINRACHLSNQAKEFGHDHYHHVELGYNYRMSNITAAIGRSQLEYLRERVFHRRRVNALYRELLPQVDFMPEADYSRSNCWLTVCLVDDPRELIEYLGINDIEARRVWKPMHMQPVFSEYMCVGGKVSEYLFKRGICLPSSSTLDENDVKKIAGIIDASGGH